MKQKHSEVILGTFSASHIGDVLCTTPLVRQIKEKYGWDVYCLGHQCNRTVFENNPFVKGFKKGKFISLNRRLRGEGHIIQRLQRGLNLNVDKKPKPEIYLTDDEVAWAKNEKAKWPDDKPKCLISTRTITDCGIFKGYDWSRLLNLLALKFTLIQPILTNPKEYTKQVPSVANKVLRQWESEEIVQGAIVYKDLPLRKYFALFSVIDFFCGSTSGGTHVAAAFDVPSVIIVWPELYRNLKFPVESLGISSSAFLYPQHNFVSSELLDEGIDKIKTLCKKITRSHLE